MTAPWRLKPSPRSRKKPYRYKNGPETWRTAQGETFTYWDQWLLVLAHDLGGLDEVVTALKSRESIYGLHGERDTEAKVAQIVDLRKRLERTGMTVLVALENEPDKTLVRKAQTKIIDQHAEARFMTDAMWETPQWRLNERALRGYWDRFPVNPAEFEKPFISEVNEEPHYGYKQTWRLAERLQRMWAEAVHRTRLSQASGLSLHRAVMTVLVEAMEVVDDSDAEMGTLFQDVFHAYVAGPWIDSGIDPEFYIRDGVEFAAWESYGLIDNMIPFFEGVDEEHGPLVQDIFGETVDELESHEFTFHINQALDYWSAFLVAHQRFDDFLDLADRVGSDQWGPIVRLAKAALDAKKRKLALEVFGAGNREGMHQKYLGEECQRLLGVAPPRYKPRLKAV